MDLNKVMIIGRLTRDPEMRTTPSGVNVCQIGLATNFVYTSQQTGQKVEQVEYHNVVLWRKLADIAGQYLKKGRRIYVEGRLQTRSWDGKDGVKRSRTEIIGDNLIMLDGGNQAGQTSQAGASYSRPVAPNTSTTNYAAAKTQTAPEQSTQNSPEEELPTIQQGEDIRVEDIPF